jgi:hypothetical protein
MNPSSMSQRAVEGGNVPFTLNVDHERQFVYAVAIGPISLDDARRHLVNEGYFEGLAYKEFMDARGAGFLWTDDEMRQIVDVVRSMRKQSNFGPTAILVSDEAAFEILQRMKSMLGTLAEIEIFRDESEARAWLAAK